MKHIVYTWLRADARFHPIVYEEPAPPINFTKADSPGSPGSRLLTSTPLVFDWRDHGMVSDVYNQGPCNTCWAITAAEHLDYGYKQENGVFGVSAQTVLDCTPGRSCNGGLMEKVFAWGGPYANDLPYTGKLGMCSAGTGSKVSEYTVLSSLVGDAVESQLAAALVEYGPLPVAVDSTSSRFLTYYSGTIEESECNKVPNHAVLVVGFTPEYWIVKNSWGTHWGNKGYANIARGSNTCGIGTYTAFVTAYDL